MMARRKSPLNYGGFIVARRPITWPVYRSVCTEPTAYVIYKNCWGTHGEHDATIKSMLSLPGIPSFKLESLEKGKGYSGVPGKFLFFLGRGEKMAHLSSVIISSGMRIYRGHGPHNEEP
ncbi:hypothetical protein M514_09057 [Trichuris suis]|uniref:Uncharacterized protein n=1 Tax=Trichuris suis TaxID=68888 RepID=A0A085MRF8_9BILA|nr:hypothetical protein M513_09057 [Trichuris suis]KFD59804.1 hypothetical protein M514_09057 [Trichuris suis]